MKRHFKPAVLMLLGVLVLSISLLHLIAGQVSLKLVPPSPPVPGQFSLKMQVQSASNSVIYVIQTSTNLVNWETLVSGRTKPGAVIQVGDVSTTNRAKFFRLNELPADTVDTNAPVWTNGVGTQFKLTPPSGFMVGWNPATDDIGVAQYYIYLNGVLITNVVGSTFSYQFTLNYQSAADIRIQAADASGNYSPILSLVYVPGNEIAALSDDAGRVYVLNYLQTNSILTNGGFTAAVKIADFPGNDRGLALGDYDRDGILDLVAGYASGNSLVAYFFKGVGDGTFASPVQLASPVGAVQNSYVMDMAAGDFDGDGNLDVAINGNYNIVVFYWGNGDGSFTPEVKNWADGNYYYGRGMAAGDFNEDGREDIARATYSSGMVKVFLSNGDRTFIETNLIASNVGNNDPYALAAGDFDEDGHLDILVAGGSAGDVTFLKGFGDGTFTNITGTNGLWANLDIGTYGGWDAYDYNGDGHLDLVMAANNGQGYFWPGNGDGTFSTNRVTIATGMSGAFGASAPPRPPLMDVSITPTDPVTNLNSTITFTAVGTGVRTNDFFRWSFGDTETNPVAWTFGAGTNNMGSTVSHTYTNEGRFLTRLWHTSTNGINSVRGTWAIVKSAPPVADPGGPYLFGSEVATQGVWYATLDGSASTDDFGIVSYVWDLGDGVVVTNAGATTFHGWPSNGVYTVSLKVIDAAGQSDTNSTSITFTNGDPPVSSINGPEIVDETYASSGTWTATFWGTNSTSPVGIWQYAWRNDTTGQTGSGSSFRTTWRAVGTNFITLTVTANDSQTNTTTFAVWVKANDLPVPVIQGPHLLSVEVATNGLWYGAWNATNSTDDTGIYNYTWNFGDGSTASGSLTTHSYGAAGNYPLTLTVKDNGNQSVTATQSVIVVAGNPPVAKITASTLSPEGFQPVAFSGDSSTSDHGIYLYTWFLPPRQFDFFGQYLDPNQWVSAGASQNEKLTLTGDIGWGHNYFFSIGTLLQRGCAIQGQVDTPSTTPTHAMVGLKNLNISSGQYGQYPYAIYFADGKINIYENGSNRGQKTNYLQGTAYDFRIETKPDSGARYYLRPSGTGQPFELIYDSNSGSDTSFSFGGDVYQGVWGFDDYQVDHVFASGSTLTAPVNPGGTVTLQVVDNGLLTNSTSVVVTPVVGLPPVAGINGPTNGQTGVQLAFDGYDSSDDYGIANYTWDFGDGSPPSFGPAITHSYSAAGVYTNTLTVADYAHQTSTASLVVHIAGGNAVVHVPWLIINGIEQPHPAYAGKTNTLKAVARGIPVPFTYVWDYGDGTGSVTNTVTNSAVIYNLEATHAYSGGDGTPYYAHISLILTNGTVYEDAYPLLLQTKTIDVEEKVAIDEGLWHLQKSQTLYDIDTNTVGGYWSSSGTVSATASSVQAFAVNGHLMTDDSTRDPYVNTVQRGVNYLLNNLLTEQIGTQAYGNPDANNNGIGLQANSGQPIYEGGPVIDAFVAAARPELIAPTGGANVKGRSFGDIVQDMADMFAWGQYDDATAGGGWRYGWNTFPDNSACQWGAIGLFAASQFWGATVPDWVKMRNLVWVNYSKGANGYGYTGPGDGIATTPSALVQLAFDGVSTTNALWQHGENYLANNWASFMGQNNVYANYAIAKAMRTANPQPVQNFALDGKDWFHDPANGLARVTIDHQAADGSWTAANWLDQPLASAWSVLILSSSLFQQGPVAVITVKPNPSAIGYPVIFDGSGSYHRHPSYKITDWRWIFDAASGADFDHPDAVGPIVTNVYGAFSTNTVLLQVRDNGTPQLVDNASVVIETTVPPYPPTADSGGPYVACAGQDVHLDASGSFCVDAAAGNFIQSYDWEVNYEVPVTFNQGVSGVRAVITNGYPIAGNYTVGLRAKNANSLVYTNFALPDQTDDAFTTVYVYNRVIADLKVRPKATKAQLTWTKTGDYAVIQRSAFGPDRGFVEVGRTTSSFATFLDTTIAYNTDYYYRVFAYRNGQTTPIGVSDPVFLHSNPRTFDEHAPQFQSTPNRLAKVGQLYEVTLDAKSPENQPMYYSLLTGPTNMTVNLTSGLVDFTPTEAQIGNIFLSFQVTNNIGRDVLSYTLFVFPATNHVPVVAVNGPYAALTGENIQFSSAGTMDEDNNTLRYYWNFGDGSTSTNANPVHAYGGIGDYLVSLFVNDGYGGTASAQTHAQITRPNIPPVAVVSNGPSFTVRLGEILTLDGSGSYSPLGNPLTYNWLWGDGTATNNASAIMSHLYADGGPYSGSLIVTDNKGDSDTNQFTVTMGNSNRPPVVSLTVSTNSPFVEGVVTFDASASSDPDGDPMTFTWDFGDHSKTTGPLVTHMFHQIQDFTVTLTVADNHGGVSVAFTTVHALNAPPVFTSSPTLLTRAGTNYTYTPTLTDADGDLSTFQLVTGPATMSCDTNTGTLNWLPGTNNMGPNTIDLRATDANGASADQFYTLVVSTPLGPQLDLQPTHMEFTNIVVDSQTLAYSGTVRVYLRNNGSDLVPVPFTLSVFEDANFDGTYSTNADQLVGYGVFPAGFIANGSAYVDLTFAGTTLFKDAPLYAFVDSQNVVPEYDESNNIMRSGSDADTNTLPVVDLSASFLQVNRLGLPATAMLTARLGNSGLVSVPTNVPLAFYDGDPTAGGQLIGVASSTNALAPGEYVDLSVAWSSPAITNHDVFVVADDPGNGTNLFPEITLSNNTFSVAVDLAAILPPVAYAGPNQNVNAGDTVSLNGRDSFDPQGRDLTYRWSMLSIPIGSHAQLAGTNTVSPSFVADVGGIYKAQLTVNNGIVDSTNPAVVYIGSTDTNVFYPPTITSKPSFQGIATVAYTYPVTATDPQGKPLTFRLSQSPAGMTINTNTGLVQWTPASAGSFLVQVTADGVGGSAYQGYTLTVIPFTNLPPEFTSTPVTTASPGTAYSYPSVAVSPVGNKITYSLSQKPSGMGINASSGVIIWTPTVGQSGGNPVTVSASDGHGGTATQSYNLVVLNSGVNGPVVQPIPDQSIKAPAAFTAFSLDNYVSDPNYADNQITWTATGTNLLSVVIDSNRMATVLYPAGVNAAEQITFLATDPDGKSAYSTATFTVIGNSTPPVAAIANLSANSTTSISTGSFNLIGTADDPGVPVPVAYRLGLYDDNGTLISDQTPAPVDAGGWHEGRVPAGGSLGNLDFTKVKNGAYTLLLEVKANGYVASATAQVAVDTPLKIGQLTFAQQDLVLPVKGVGLQVNRTYDSFNPYSADFGYSWTYSVADLGVKVGDQRVITQDETDDTTFSLRTGGSWDVTLTMPDSGRTVTFTYSLAQGSFTAQAVWTPPAWVHASLAPTISSTLVTLPGLPPIWQAGGFDTDWQAFDWPGFVLTLQNGTKYVISREDQGEHFYASDTGFGGYVHAYGTPYVSKIIEPDGSHTDFIHNGTATSLNNIIQYDGANQLVKSFLFQRDGKKRITSIYTPEHLDTNGVPNGPASVTYAYDTTGNLVAVSKLMDASNPTNPVYGTFQYLYANPGFPHLLTEIKDPRGIPVFQAIFDDSGRLVGTKDANGNLVALQHNMGARTETTFDRMGNPTQYGYDEKGNITSKTDPLGNTTTFTFDSSNRRTSMTDPLGNTTTFAYDANGNMNQLTDPLGHKISFTATADGNPTSYTDPLGHTTILNLDAAGHLTNSIDPLGNVVQQKYDAAGNMTDLIDPNGHTMEHLTYASGGALSHASNVAGQSLQLTFDDSGHVASHITQWVNPADSNDVRTLTSYVGVDYAGRVTNRTDALGHSLSKVYDELNDVIQTTDFRGNTVSNSFDANGNLIESRDADGRVIQTVYDANDREVVQVDAHLDGKDADGTEIIYDANGNTVSTIRLSKVVVALSSSTIGGVSVLSSHFVSAGGVISSNYIAYDADGRQIAITDTTGQTTRFEYDAAGHKTAIVDPLGNRTTMDYDASGHNIAIHDPLGHETDFLYDADGRLTKTVFQNGASTSTTYTPAGQTDTTTDPLGRVTKMLYDDLGVGDGMMLPQTTDPENGNALTNPVYKITFDANRNIQQMIDAKGRMTAFTYDQFNRRTSRTLPLGQVEQMAYDAAGDVSRITDFDGQAMEFHYDGLGHVVSRNLYVSGGSSPAETANLKYDELGRVVEMDEPRGVTKMFYDLENRITKISTPEGVINYAYDPATGWKTRTWTTNSDTYYAYDELGRLQTITAVKRNGQVLNPPEATAYTYTTVGNRASATLPNGIMTLYGYDEMSRLISLQQVGTNGAVLMSFAYQYNAANMRTNAIEVVTGPAGAVHTNIVSYAYDELNRLVRESANDLEDGSGYQANYAYDLVGNRLSRAVTTAGKTLTTYYSYDANDRLLMESNVVDAATSGGAMSGSRTLAPNGEPLPAVDSLFAKLCYYTIKGAPVGLLVAFLVPAIISLIGRRRRPAVLTLDMNPHHALLPRCISGCLVVLMILMGFDLRIMANEAVYYAALTTDTWGLDGSVTTYQYDANGSVVQKVTTGPKPETDTFQYTLLKQLAVSTRTYTNAGNQVVETTKNTYNYDGIRVSSEFSTKVNGVLQSSATNYFLIDPFNHTGFAQVMEELPAIGAVPTVSYTIGNEIIAQSSDSSGAAQYLLKDGHDSTRQLASSAGFVTDYYGYDAFGMMLGGNPTASNPSTTKMLYSGQQFDSTLGLYNQRARFYDPGVGRFTTMDSYEGSPQDPQSLHKYTYCANNPVNYHDPSGHDFSLGEVMCAVAIVGILASFAVSAGFAIFHSGAFPDSAMVGISASISGYGPGVSILNIIATAVSGGPNHAGTIVAGDLLSFANLGFSSAKDMLGKIAGATITAGAERLYTTSDISTSDWTYYGPGFYISPNGSGNPISGTVTIYAGVCWNVQKYDKYAGGFESISFGAGASVFGWAISIFWSDSTPGQNGFNVGLTFSVPKGIGTAVSAGIGFSYTEYTLASSGSWDHPVPLLTALCLVPGVGIPWSFILAYKYGYNSAKLNKK